MIPEGKKLTIAARHRGPGPARYLLPSCFGFQGHDVTKKTMPAHTIGKRLGLSMYGADCSPGPRYLMEEKITRFGKDGTPAYSILGRGKNLDPNSGPSPATYCPEKSPPLGDRAPIYSIGGRTRYQRRDPTPSANAYTLPSMLGHNLPNKHSSPAYSMRSRAFNRNFESNPGPGRYDVVKPGVYVKRAPEYSISARLDTASTAVTPGPGAHSPERVNVHKPAAPRFSMGVRHSEYVTPLIVEID